MSPLSPQGFADHIASQAKLEPHHTSHIRWGIESPGTTDLIPARAENVIANIPAIVYAVEHGELAEEVGDTRARVTAMIESLFTEEWRLQTLGKDVFRYFELLENFVEKDRLKAWLAAYIDRITKNKQYGGAGTFRYFAALNLDRLQSLFADDPDFLTKISAFLGNNVWVPAHAVVAPDDLPPSIVPERDLSCDEQLIIPNVCTVRGVQRAETVCNPQAETYHSWTSLNTTDLAAQDRKYIVVDGKLVGSVKWGTERETKQHSFLSFRTVRDEKQGTYPLIENALYLVTAEMMQRVRETAENVVHFSSNDDVGFMPQRAMEDSQVGSGTNYGERVRAVRGVVEQKLGIST